MTATIALITYLVRDYDEAISWFRNALGFALIQDEDQGGGKRWVVMAPGGGTGARFLIAKANEEQAPFIGKAAGTRVAFFLHTSDFKSLHEKMSAAGVRFLETPRYEIYGTVAVFEDLYGNRWDLLEPKA